MMCTTYRKHYPNSSVKKFYLPRNKGGRGYVDVCLVQYKHIQNMRNYLYEKSKSSLIHRIKTEIDQNITPLHLKNRLLDTQTLIQSGAEKIDQWRKRSFTGGIRQHFTKTILITKHLADGCVGAMSSEEGFMIAIQDQVIPTKNYRKHVIKDNSVVSDKCRM